MWSRLFPAQQITKDELLDLTLKNFYPFAIREVEILFKITKGMLTNLKASNSDFDEQFNKIVFGTMIISLVIESKKYGINYYPFYGKQNYDVIAVLASLYDSSAMEIFILEIGKKVLINELPFDSSYIDKHFSTLAKNVPSINNALKHIPRKLLIIILIITK